MTQMVLPTLPVIVMPQGASVLPLVELDKMKVKTKGREVQLRSGTKKRKQAQCSFGNFTGQLNFTAWELFHAAKKTELTRTFTSARAARLGLLFADEHSDRFVWNTGNLRCTDGSGLWLEDFSKTGLAGRIGEALAYLTMVKTWGYCYWDRIASVWLRAARSANIQHQEMVQVAQYTGQITQNMPTPQPDFVFEKPDQAVAQMEAKGSFVTPGDPHPDVKHTLKHGLDQLDAWTHLIAPAPASSIAIGSFLREDSDPFSDPSLILHVDPPTGRRPNVQSVELPSDLIRRGNFGAWIAAMGFSPAGRALAERRTVEASPVDLPVITLNGRDFAITVHGFRVDTRRIAAFPWHPLDFLFGFSFRHLRFARELGVTGIYGLGLELTALRATEAALADLRSTSLLELRPVEFVQDQTLDGLYGSIMPDGSLMGVISSRFFDSKIRSETFKL
jgi:hypothetical protein